MKSSISSLCKFVNTHRMVSDYLSTAYLPAHRRFHALDNERAARARSPAVWLAKIAGGWNRVRIVSVDDLTAASTRVGGNVLVKAIICLCSLSPDDVAVELYMGRLSPQREICDAAATLMRQCGESSPGTFQFRAEARCTRSGLHGYTVRVRPTHADLPVPILPGFMLWADTPRSSPNRMFSSGTGSMS
jgi:starch phosphorylase